MLSATFLQHLPPSCLQQNHCFPLHGCQRQQLRVPQQGWEQKEQPQPHRTHPAFHPQPCQGSAAPLRKGHSKGCSHLPQCSCMKGAVLLTPHANAI